MSFVKYYGIKQDQDGETLWWPGGPGGWPFRGSVAPTTTSGEYENLALCAKFRCRNFNLGDADDLKDYVNIQDRCTNRLYARIDRERIWDPEIKNFRIYMEWAELAYEIPQTKVDAIKESAKDANVEILPIHKLAGFNKGW